MYPIILKYDPNKKPKILHYSALVDLLPTAYEKEERGKIEVKGKGEMTTYWINGKSGRTAPTKDEVRITGYQ